YGLTDGDGACALHHAAMNGRHDVCFRIVQYHAERRHSEILRLQRAARRRTRHKEREESVSIALSARSSRGRSREPSVVLSQCLSRRQQTNRLGHATTGLARGHTSISEVGSEPESDYEGLGYEGGIGVEDDGSLLSGSDSDDATATDELRLDTTSEIGVADCHGHTALHAAIRYGWPECVRHLISAEGHIRTEQGMTPLCLAGSRSGVEVVRGEEACEGFVPMSAFYPPETQAEAEGHAPGSLPVRDGRVQYRPCTCSQLAPASGLPVLAHFTNPCCPSCAHRICGCVKCL
ncbi:hypothetical protein KIPB_014245, partial [Kipferlia bialata]